MLHIVGDCGSEAAMTAIDLVASFCAALYNSQNNYFPEPRRFTAYGIQYLSEMIIPDKDISNSVR